MTPIEQFIERLDGRGYTKTEIEYIVPRWCDWYDRLTEQGVVRRPGPNRSVTVGNMHEYLRDDEKPLASIAYDAKGDPLHKLNGISDASIIVSGY